MNNPPPISVQKELFDNINGCVRTPLIKIFSHKGLEPRRRRPLSERSEKAAGEAYPDDVPLNSAFIGNCLFCNPRTIDPFILNYALKSGHTITSVRQGYTKCSIAIITESAIITADTIIAKKAKELKMDVLKIREGHIELSGFSYGFIGGCCGKISRDLMVFTGNIELHPDGKNIISFLRNYGIYAYSLSQEHILKDIGGIIPVAEN